LERAWAFSFATGPRPSKSLGKWSGHISQVVELGKDETERDKVKEFPIALFVIWQHW
jgi:hypothetical protein